MCLCCCVVTEAKRDIAEKQGRLKELVFQVDAGKQSVEKLRSAFFNAQITVQTSAKAVQHAVRDARWGFLSLVCSS